MLESFTAKVGRSMESIWSMGFFPPASMSEARHVTCQGFRVWTLIIISDLLALVILCIAKNLGAVASKLERGASGH